MNRRQFLTGVSAAAVASALPAVPALPLLNLEIDKVVDRFVLQQIYFVDRWFWIGGCDQIVHFSEPCDPHTFCPRIPAP